MSAGHNGGAYFKSHPKSRLAFVVKAVMIWCADQRSFIDDPVSMAAAKTKISTDVAIKLGSVSADTVEHFANIEFAAFQNELIACKLSEQIRLLTTPRPKKGRAVFDRFESMRDSLAG